MRKIFTVLLTLVFVLALTACAQTPPAADPVPTPMPEPTPNPEQVYRNSPIEWKEPLIRDMVYEHFASIKGGEFSGPLTPKDLEGFKYFTLVSDKEMYLGSHPGFDIVPDANGVVKGNQGNYTEADSAELCLDDLRHFKNLEVLFVSFVDVSDISFVKDMKFIKSIYLCGCGIEDISPFAEVKKSLNDLNLCCNNISDISALSNVKTANLWLDRNNISDISPIGEMEKIPTQLILSYNNISDISALSVENRGRKAYAYFNLRNNNISDISVFAEYESITMLSLSCNNITDITPLRRFPRDTSLYLSQNPVEDWRPLGNFTKVYK